MASPAFSALWIAFLRILCPLPEKSKSNGGASQNVAIKCDRIYSPSPKFWRVRTIGGKDFLCGKDNQF